MIYPTDADGQIRNNGYYDPFPYRFWSYPKTSRNPFENPSPRSSVPYIANRIIRPKMLCFLNDAARAQRRNGLLAEHEWNVNEPTYIFVSYTGEGQFGRRCEKGGDCRCKY